MVPRRSAHSAAVTSGELLFENLHTLGVRRCNRLLLQVSVSALLQPLRPQPEPDGEGAVRHGMPRFANGERNGAEIETRQNDRDGKPDRRFESHGVLEPDVKVRYRVSNCGVLYTP